MPFLYITSLIQLLITFYFDKLFLLRVSKLPKNYDENLETVVRQSLYFIGVIHLIFTIFMYGNPKIFEQKLFSNALFSNTINTIASTVQSGTDNLVAKFFTRIQIQHNIVLTIILVVMVGAFSVQGFLLTILKRTIFSVFAKDEDYARKQASNSRLQNITNRLKGGIKPEDDKPFFGVIESEDIATLIRLTKVTIKTTQNEDLAKLYRQKLELLKGEYNRKRLEEETGAADPNVNFIGFYTYDVRLNPTYKAQFAIEEQLDDEDLN